MRFPGIHFWLALDKLPDERVEAAELMLHREKRFGVLNRGSNLEAIADDGGIRQQRGGFLVVKTRNLADIEAPLWRLDRGETARRVFNSVSDRFSFHAIGNHFSVTFRDAISRKCNTRQSSKFPTLAPTLRVGTRFSTLCVEFWASDS